MTFQPQWKELLVEGLFPCGNSSYRHNFEKGLSGHYQWVYSSEIKFEYIMGRWWSCREVNLLGGSKSIWISLTRVNFALAPSSGLDFCFLGTMRPETWSCHSLSSWHQFLLTTAHRQQNQPTTDWDLGNCEQIICAPLELILSGIQHNNGRV